MSETTLPHLARYYQWHAPLYDLTRWAFLFGRSRMIKSVARHASPKRILEIGCGTGTNLANLAVAFPNAEILGVDLSESMLSKAQGKVKKHGPRVAVMHHEYRGPIPGQDPFDLILVSYCLSMINPGLEHVLELCREDLQPLGHVAVVDFHMSKAGWFRNWMRLNHVRLDGQVLRALELCALTEVRCEVREAYGGLWNYICYLGRKEDESIARVS